STAAQQALKSHQDQVGAELPPGDWHLVTQDQVNAFAKATLDEQFIHIDPERAKQTPFGGTIAHGFLTLSLLVHLVESIRQPREAGPRPVMGINYGLDRVRFPSPVPVGSRIRARQTLKSVELKDERTLQLTHTVVVEIEGRDKPACVA